MKNLLRTIAYFVFASLASHATQYHWNNSYAVGGRYHWNNSYEIGGKYHWNNSYEIGGKYHWNNSYEFGGKYYWTNSYEVGGKYYWERGFEKGSKYYWEKGYDRGSKYHWNNSYESLKAKSTKFANDLKNNNSNNAEIYKELYFEFLGPCMTKIPNIEICEMFPFN